MIGPRHSDNDLFLWSDMLLGVARVGLHPGWRITLRTPCRGTAGRGVSWASGTLWLGLSWCPSAGLTGT